MTKRTTTDTTTTTTDGVPIRRVPMGFSGREQDRERVEREDRRKRMSRMEYEAEMGFVEESRIRHGRYSDD